MSTIHLFVSFDFEYDQELYEQLLEDSLTQGSGFDLIGSSAEETASEVHDDRVRECIREADQLIVICGERAETSQTIAAELSIAQEEHTPYILLRGRRELMCKKPSGARRSDGIYSWTRQILRDRIEFTKRKAETDAAAEAIRLAKERQSIPRQ